MQVAYIEVVCISLSTKGSSAWKRLMIPAGIFLFSSFALGLKIVFLRMQLYCQTRLEILFL